MFRPVTQTSAFLFYVSDPTLLLTCPPCLPPGVLHTSVVLLTEMCERSPDMLAHFRKVPTTRLRQRPLTQFYMHLFRKIMSHFILLFACTFPSGKASYENVNIFDTKVDCAASFPHSKYVSISFLLPLSFPLVFLLLLYLSSS